MAIGDQVFDLKKASGANESFTRPIREALQETSLNRLFALGPPALRDLRRMAADMLDQGSSGNQVRRHASELLAPMDECTFHLPTKVANYTDFYAGIYHARAAGALLTPENPLPQNYKWVPIAYHGRASSVQVGQGAVRRPLGQRPPAAPGRPPSFGACERLDFELEMGFYLGGGNRLGKPIPIAEASAGDRRFLAAERLVGARHPALGDVSAGSLSEQKLRDLGLALGGHRAMRWRLSASRRCRGRRAIRVRSITCSTTRIRQTAGWMSISRCYLSTAQMRGDA